MDISRQRRNVEDGYLVPLKQMKLLYLCERCNSLCTLKHPALNGAVLLIFGGPFFFGLLLRPLACFPTNLGSVAAADWVQQPHILGGPVLGRFIHKYVPPDVLPNSALLTAAFSALRCACGAANAELGCMVRQSRGCRRRCPIALIGCL